MGIRKKYSCEDVEAQLPVNWDDFERGVKAMSELCGKITALVSAGVSPDKALEYFSALEDNVAVAENNKIIAKINADASVEVAKVAATQDMS